MYITLIKRLLLCGFLCPLMFNAYAQQKSVAIPQANTLKNQPDSVPKKYQNIHKRSPVLSCALSLIIPGAGQVYNKQVGKGLITFGVWTASFGAAEIYYSGNKQHPHDGVTASLLIPFFAAYVYSAIDAPVQSVYLNKKYHLGKKKNALSTFQLNPGLINSGAGRYVVGASLVIR